VHNKTNTTEYVWIKTVSQFKHLWRPLAEGIYRQKNLRPLFIVASEEDRNFYKKQSFFEFSEIEIVVQPSLYEIAIAKNNLNVEELLKTANKLERRFNISLWRDFLQQDRHFGRGMVWGWNGLPKSKASEKASYAGQIRACLESFKFYEELLAAYPPALVVGYALGTGIAAKPIPLLCKEKEIDFRTLSSSRLGASYYWAIDEFNNSPELERVIIRKQKNYHKYFPKSDVKAETSALHTYFSKKGGNHYSIIRAVRLSFLQLLRGLYGYVKGYRKSKFGYYPLSSAYSVLFQWWAFNQTKKYPFVDVCNLPKDRKLVLFPLQYEFEASLYGESPESNSLLFAIYETAISLPAGTTLVVKEHPLQPGRRPRDFYDLVLRLPNVILLRPDINSSDILRRCEAVVQINSSLGYEAIVQGIPVYSFSRHGPIRSSSNNTEIRRSEDLITLRNQLLCDSQAGLDEKRRALGSAYLSAVEEYCFLIPEMKKLDEGKFSISDLDAMLRALPLKF
jgi:hypothetical protein